MSTPGDHAASIDGGEASPNSGPRVLLFYSDYSSNADAFRANLVATGLLTTADIDLRAMTGIPPALEVFTEYACVITWTNLIPAAPNATGNRLKDYVDAGGGVVLAAYAYSVGPWKLGGGIMEPAYSPFQLSGSPIGAGSWELDFANAEAGHPFLNGVANFAYGSNSAFDRVTMAPGAVEVGSNDGGMPVVGQSASGKVAGINVFPVSGSSSAGVYRVFVNACLSTAGIIKSDSNQAPTADAGPDQTVECTGSDGCQVTLDGSGSTDPDGDGLTYTWSWGDDQSATGESPAITLPLGAHTITLTVSDGERSDTDEVTITVVDTTPPTIDLVVTHTVLWPPNGKMHLVASGISATDTCDPAPALTVELTSSDPLQAKAGSQGGGAGRLMGVAQALGVEVVANDDGTFDVYVRAEPTRGNADRVYTITAKATDASGNEAVATGTVTVPRSAPRP